jgi:hypothetical protein
MIDLRIIATPARLPILANVLTICFIQPTVTSYWKG